MHWVFGLALAFVLVLTLVEAAGAGSGLPNGLAMRWCGTERAADVRRGWFPQARPQVKVVYAFARDQGGQFEQYSHLIQQDVKASLELVGDASAGRRSIAFDLGTECGHRYVDIASVPLSGSSADYTKLFGSDAGPNGRAAAIRKEVRAALGLGVGDTLGGGKRNFAVYVNIGPIDQSFNSARGDLPGCPLGGTHPSCEPDDRPGADNKANLGGYWAWVWKRIGTPAGWPPHTPRGHLAMLHEITHNLGAVQNSAPHASSFHCTDGRDVMCRGVATDPFPCPAEAYDCGKDDYFDINPTPGSYLDSHWNVARSVFTCPYYSSPSERGCAPQGAAGDFNGDGRSDLAVGVPDEDVGTVVDAGAVNVLYGTRSGISSSEGQFWHQSRGGVRDLPEAGDRFGSALTAGDFNRDGFADLAVGVPGEDIGAAAGAGAVNVLYGSALGLSSASDQFWHQDILGPVVHAEAGDSFGEALAAGDFGGDGSADLAVGIPYEDLALDNAGAVNVLYGSASRLTATGNQFWHQNRLNADLYEAGDRFGAPLAAGDVSGDGFADLAVGVPREDVGAVENAGAVNVLYGAVAGLSSTGNQFWHQDILGPVVHAEAGDRFGEALAAGDFGGDGFADLAVGIPYEDLALDNAGAVNVLYGSASRLTATGNQFWHQDRLNADFYEAGDRFGAALAAGDFGGDGFAGLAVGVPLEDVATVANAGAVNVLYGTVGGLSAIGNQFWHQDSFGVRDGAEAGDVFGWSLSAADFSGDLPADLAVGVPDEDHGGAADAGAVNLVYNTGITFGLEAAGNQVWGQNGFLVLDNAEVGDVFGDALGR